MKLSIKDSSKILFNKTVKLLFIFSLTAFVGDARAQSVNDDLQPKTAAKRSTPRRKGTRTTKPRPRTTFKKPAISLPSAAPVNPSVTSPSKNPPVVNEPPAAVTPLIPTQTPDEILERYMNFQQSTGITGKDWESVVNQTSVALQSNPNDLAKKAQLFIAQGEIAYSRSDYSTALIQFNGAANALSDSALPYYCIGKVYLITKQPNQAQVAFEKSLKRKKDFALAYKGLGDLMTAQNKTKKADEYYKQAARYGLTNGDSRTGKNPDPDSGGIASNAPADSTLGNQNSVYDAEIKAARTLTTQKQWQNSLEKLFPLEKNHPTAELYTAIGDNYFGLQQMLSAQQAFRKATEANPNTAQGFYKLGVVLLEMNEYRAASEALEKSIILDQSGKTINRSAARKMADKASDKARELEKNTKKKNFLGF